MIANHPEGLGIPQVMVARCDRDTDDPNLMRVRGSEEAAFGPTTLKEQDELAERGLDDYLYSAREKTAPEFNSGFRKLWAGLDLRLGPLPSSGPFLVIRSPDVPHDAGETDVVLAEPGSHWECLLDELCDFFEHEPESESRQNVAIGVVPVGNPPNHFLFTARQRFERQSESTVRTRCDQVRGESLKALYDLASMANLAFLLQERNKLEADIEYYRSELFPQVFHRFMEPIRDLDIWIEKSIRDGKVTPEYEELIRGALNLLRMKRNTVRIAAGKNEGIDKKNWKSFPLGKAIDAIVRQYACLFDIDGVWFDDDTPDEVKEAEIFGELALIQTVIGSLLDNARRAMEPETVAPEDKKVLLGAELVDCDGNASMVRFTVTDYGIPVPSDAELFVAQKSTWDGFGVGLIASKRIVEDHGGTLELASEVGLDGPKTFVVDLPLTGAKNITVVVGKEETEGRNG